MVSNEIKVATTILLAIVLAVFGFRTMRDIPFFKEKIEIVSVFNKVDGLSAGKTVYINGVDVGNIKRISLGASDSVEVLLSVDDDVVIPGDSRAFIRSLDLIGSKAIVIEKGKSPKKIEDGGRIKGVFDEGAFTELQEKGLTFGDKVVQTTDNVNRLVDSLSLVISRDLRKSLKESVNHVESISGRMDALLKQREKELSQSIVHLENVLANTDTLSGTAKNNIEEVLTMLKTNSRELSGLSQELSSLTQSLQVTLDKINQGEGTVGKLMNDPSLYNNLDSLSYSLQRLLQNVDKNPERYLKHLKIRLF